jgi:hypothetical protein
MEVIVSDAINDMTYGLDYPLPLLVWWLSPRLPVLRHLSTALSYHIPLIRQKERRVEYLSGSQV